MEELSLVNKLVYEERQYGVAAQTVLHQKIFSSLTGEHNTITCSHCFEYNIILKSLILVRIFDALIITRDEQRLIY